MDQKKNRDAFSVRGVCQKSLIYLKEHKLFAGGLIVGSIVVIAVIITICVFAFVNRNRPQVYQLIGMKISAAEQLLADNEISYTVEGSTFDESAKDEQTVSKIIRLYNSKGSEITVKDKRRLLKGYKVVIYTDYITQAQHKEIDACKAKGDDYFYIVTHGAVQCNLTSAAKLRQEKEACEKDGKVWFDDDTKCITKEEANERRAKAEEEKRRAEGQEKQKRDDEERRQEEERRRQEEASKQQNQFSPRETTCFETLRLRIANFKQNVASKDDKQLVEVDLEVSKISDFPSTFYARMLNISTTKGLFSAGKNLNNELGLTERYHYDLNSGQTLSGKMYFWIPGDAVVKFINYAPSDENCVISLE